MVPPCFCCLSYIYDVRPNLSYIYDARLNLSYIYDARPNLSYIYNARLNLWNISHEKSSYFRIGNNRHQLRNLYDTETRTGLDILTPVTWGNGSATNEKFIFTLHLTNPFQTEYLTGFHHRRLSVKHPLLYLPSLIDFHLLN